MGCVSVACAEALLGRGWAGDAALALRDCDTALALHPGYAHAHLCRVSALKALQQYQVRASAWLGA